MWEGVELGECEAGGLEAEGGVCEGCWGSECGCEGGRGKGGRVKRESGEDVCEEARDVGEGGV